MTDAPAATRIDIWLWRARFFRTRSLSAKTAAGGLRINGRRTDKPGAAVRVGDVLTFVQAGRVRVIEILDLGERRGPATEAQALYRDRDHARTGAPET
ncbi:MAG: RNA-binding S4 domain-containing protein [Rubrimonas sp.]